MDNKKILIIAHGHPDVHKGGAELAAYQLFQEYEAQGLNVMFLARSEEPPHGGAAFSIRNKPNELLFHTRQDDDFMFSNIRTRYIWSELRDLLARFKPDVVHFHHFFLMGIETLLEVRKTLPDAKIVFTLHEYLAICHRNGLMVKNKTNALCSKASPRDCHGCFPEKSPADFFMREMYIKRAFSVVDTFISPSHFLKQRYKAWGLEESSIHVIENGIAKIDEKGVKAKQHEELIHLAYFGQINSYKGLDVLLNSLLLLDRKDRKRFVLDIHGANLEHQPKRFQNEIFENLEKLKGTVFLHGAYQNADLPSLLDSAHWAVVPSIWWENSPIVIQEAFRSGVPVIASNIGGMAEKVVHEVNGLHFSVGKVMSLKNSLLRLIHEPDLYRKCCEGITAPLTIADSAKQNLALY
jgi:glycosyltransferase involved in cell wall biosynthesis